MVFLDVSVRAVPCLAKNYATADDAPIVIYQIFTQLPLINDLL
jgi:hypothetical protein